MSERTTTIGNYEFVEKGHKHLLDGKPLTGVTTVLGILNKPALLPWASKMAVEYLIENGRKEYLPIPEGEPMHLEGYLVTEEQLNEAKTAYAKKRDKAGEQGTDIHAKLENFIKSAIQYTEGFISSDSDEEPQVNEFLQWAKGKKFLASEIHLFSKPMFVGGICDIVYEENGKKYLADIKTGSGIYAEMFWQMGGYHLMIEEMGLYEGIDGYTVVNIPKKGGLNVETSYGLEQNKEGFKHCLAIYRLINEVKKTI